ncbi:hypothetical protein [Myxococcus xanthus]|uniref:hypothetical protein n=1 Tax=Myxococcus xanthus TaxID=34 RepID=UPI0011286D2F|nr:hypothetical protein [Myxococcus xanthus]
MSNPDTPPGAVREIILDPILRSRGFRGIIRALNTGTSLYLISIVSISTSIFFLRETLQLLTKNNQDIRTEIEKFLQQRPDTEIHQPETPGILSFTLNHPPPSAPSTKETKARAQAKQIELAFKSTLETPAQSKDATRQFIKQLLPHSLPEALRRTVETDLEQYLAPCPPPCTISVIPCPPPLPPSTATDFDLTVPGCDAFPEVRTQLFVPAVFNNCHSNKKCSHQHSCLENANPDQPDCFPTQIYEAARLSRALDIFLQAFTPPTCDFQNEESTLVSAYFLTPGGVVRYWNCLRSPGTPSVTSISRQVAYASYIYRLTPQSSPADYETDIYLDPDGFGPIRTRCTRINFPHPETTHSLGVLCFDFTVSLTEILKPLIQSNVISVDTAEFTMPDAGNDLIITNHWTFEANPEQTGDIPPSPSRKRSSNQTRNTFEQNLAHTLNTLHSKTKYTPALLRDLNTSVISLSSKDGKETDGHFLVPGGWGDNGLTRRMLVVRPSITLLRNANFYIFLTILSFTLWIGILYWGNRWNRRTSTNELVVQLLRRLEIGILLIDKDGSIMAANDEAENILKTFLPQLNTSRLRIDEGFRQIRLSSEPEIYVKDLILPTVIPAEEVKKAIHGRDTKQREIRQEKLTTKQYDDIREKRLRGHPVTFYARLTNKPNKDRWIKITTAPVIIQRTGAEDLTTSLSVFELVTTNEVHLVRLLDFSIQPSHGNI